LEIDRDLVRLHDGNEPEVSKMHFMYDKAYGKVLFGHAKDSLHFTRCSTNSLGLLSHLEVVIPRTSPIGPKNCFIKWPHLNEGSMCVTSYGGR
jgi:hypothetical protein